METASISSKIGRQYTRVGTWNVRTLMNKEQEVIKEMKKYRLSVLGVSETHLKGCREKETGGAVMVYSGVTEGRAKGGIAPILAGKMRDCLKEWQCVSERLVKVQILFEKKWTTFIQVYAPTEDSEKEEKDRFYASLEGVLEKVKKDDRLVLMGDLNGRVGRDVETWEEVIGRHGEDTQNDNGRRFLETCATNGLTIMNRCFEHKDIHKYTWECRGQGLRTIIDYFAVRKALRQTVADVKVIRGEEAGSDHYLILMKVNLRWTRRKEEVRNEGTRLRLRKLLDWGERVRFQTEEKVAIQEGP